MAGLASSFVLFGRMDPDYEGSPNAESVQALDRLGEQGPAIDVLIDHVDPQNPQTQQALAAFVADSASSIDAVEQVLAPLPGPDGQIPPEAQPLIAKDGGAVLVIVQLADGIDRDDREAALSALREKVPDLEDQLRESDSDATVGLGGSPVVFETINEQINKDLILAEGVSIPVTAIILVIVFAGVLPALMPIIGAVAAIAGGLLVLLGFSYLLTLSSQIAPVVTMLGLGLCIDYSLLIVSRFREERAAGADVHEAVARTVDRAGRTVAFSAITVAIALLGLLVFTEPIFRSVGAAGVSVVVVALLASVTLVPALLAVLGHRIKVAHVTEPGEGRFAALARFVQRRAWLVFIAATVLLIVLASPALRLKMSASTAGLLPSGSVVRTVTDSIQERFAGREADPVIVVSDADPATLDSWLAERAPELTDDGLVRSVSPASAIEAGGSVAQLIPAGTSEGEQATALVEQLRSDRMTDDTLVTGSAAFLVDFQDSLADRAWLALALVVLSTFVLLFLLTGSVLIPIKALLMNVISLGASFGALVLIFQDGVGEAILGFESHGAIETTVPVLVFAFAFGLAMDYEVFLLSRIVEEHGHPENGGDTDRAVAVGLQRSGRIITSAAIVIMIVFLGFALAKTLLLKEIGIALAVAVLIDATVVRMLLVPATMTLLGRANWWAPAWMRRLQKRFAIRH